MVSVGVLHHTQSNISPAVQSATITLYSHLATDTVNRQVQKHSEKGRQSAKFYHLEHQRAILQHILLGKCSCALDRQGVHPIHPHTCHTNRSCMTRLRICGSCSSPLYAHREHPLHESALCTTCQLLTLAATSCKGRC